MPKWKHDYVDKRVREGMDKDLAWALATKIEKKRKARLKRKLARKKKRK